MTAPEIGSLAWGDIADGRLSRRERRELRRRTLTGIAQFAASRLRTSARRGRHCANAPLAVVDVPDTALARAVEAVARERQSPAMMAHAFRSVAFAHAVAALDEIDVDPELLWCACLMHDVALESPEPGQCFAVRGGRIARDTALAAGASAKTAQMLGDAVSRHPTPGLDVDFHPLPAVLTAGALVDVLGHRLDDMDPAFVCEVLAAYPRQGFAGALARAWTAEAKATPDGRAALVRRVGCFTVAARLAPLPRN
jgi:hypothetical protein